MGMRLPSSLFNLKRLPRVRAPQSVDVQALQQALQDTLRARPEALEGVRALDVAPMVQSQAMPQGPVFRPRQGSLRVAADVAERDPLLAILQAEAQREDPSVQPGPVLEADSRIAANDVRNTVTGQEPLGFAQDQPVMDQVVQESILQALRDEVMQRSSRRPVDYLPPATQQQLPWNPSYELWNIMAGGRIPFADAIQQLPFEQRAWLANRRGRSGMSPLDQ